MYAGTGEGFGARNNILGDGIWKSMDGGENWEQLPATAGGVDIALIYRLIVNPDDENEILFASLSHPRLPRGQGFTSSIYRTRDGGLSLSPVFTSDRAIQQIVADPTDFSKLYACINGSGIISSEDGGNTWMQIYETTEFQRMELAISPTATGHLYISAQGTDPAEDANNSHLLYSPDAGENWFEVEPINAQNAFGDWFSGQGWYDNTLAVHPYDSQVVYVGGAGPILEIRIEEMNERGDRFLASMDPVTDGYAEYRRRYPEARSKGVHVDHHNILLIPRDSVAGSFYFINANDGGVAFSKDGGRTFLQTGDTFKEDCDDPFCNTTIEYETAGGLNTSQFYGVDKQNGSNRYVAGTQDNGSWVSVINPIESSPWISAPSGDGFEAIWHYTKANQLVESSQFNAVFRSDDGGQRWRSLDLPGQGPFLTRLAGSQQDPDLIFAVSDLGVLKSFDFGETWQIIDMPDTWRFEGLGTPIRISLANPNIVWTGSGLRENADMAMSLDGGTTFQVISRYSGATLGLTTNIATHPTDDSTAYFLFSQADGPKIVRTTDLGQTLEDITGFGINREESTNGYPDVATYSLVVMPYNDQILWAGTEIGLFESLDGGVSWQLADNGLPHVAIYDMKIVNQQVVLATHGRGIWSVDLPELEGYEPPAVLALAPQILLNNDDFGANVSGVAALRSPADSNVVSFELDGASIPQSLSLGANAIEFEAAFSETIAGVEGEDFYELKVIISSYFGEVVLRSQATTLVHAIAEESVQTYATDFDDGLRDFARKDWEILQPEGFDNLSLNSPHPYFGNESYIAVLQIPINIGLETTPLSYDEVVLVEPGDTDDFPSQDFYDYCLVEGTPDLGATWKTVAFYDSRDREAWLSQYELDENLATADLEINRSLDLNDVFDPGDEVYLRFRLVSDPFVEGWGWSIDNLEIGSESTPTVNLDQAALAYNLLSNPVPDQLQVEWLISEPTEFNFQITSLAGQILSQSQQKVADHQISTFDVSTFPPGLYLLQVHDGSVGFVIKWMKM